MSDKRVVRVLLVDDHQIMLDGLQKLLESSGDFEIVGQARTGDQAVSLVIEHQPDVVIMDVILTGRDGIDACREIKETVPDTRVLILTAATEEESVINAISAGATGYLRKLSNAQKLLDTIRDVAEGEYRIPQEVMRKVFAGIRTSPQLADKSTLDRLTEREKQILQLFAWGRSYADIAKLRGNQTVTIRNAIYGIQNKIGVKSKQEMVLWAVRNGLLNNDPNDIIPSEPQEGRGNPG